MAEANHYYDLSHPLRPYVRSGYANPGSTPPPGATRDAPPKLPKGKWPGYSPSGWVALGDHRGERGWVNGEPHAITDFGPYPDGWSIAEPPKTASQLREIRRAEILAALGDIDRRSARPARALELMRAKGAPAQAAEGELSFLAGLEAQAEGLRAELAGLG